MPEATLTQIEPIERALPPSSDEAQLRALYAHPAGALRVGMIASADGRAAGPDGSSRSLNGPEDVRVLRVLRSLADVVLVGARTARAERYGDIALPPALVAAREADGPGPLPILAIATASGDMPPGLDPERTWVITTATAAAIGRLGGRWHERVIVAGNEDLNPHAVISELRARGSSRVLCEGGPELAGRFFARGLVADYCLTRSPHAGGNAAPETPDVPAGSRLAHRLEGGGFTMDRWVTP